MTNSHMKRIIRWCILLLTAAVFFPLGLSAQQQAQPTADETGFYYTVQKGDTLWDISQKFFNDSELWPDLWGRNQELTNPHWIYPGDVLHIYMSGGKLYVKKVEPEPEPKSESLAPRPAPEPAYYLYTSIDQVGFIRNPAVSPDGTIFKIKGEKNIASVGDIVYIRQEGTAALPVGSLFTTYRNYDPIKDPANPKTTVGTQHYLTGVAKITRHESGYSLAEVVQSFRAIEIGDRAMPHEETSRKIYLPENTPDISGIVLLSEERSFIMGEHSIAFIDKGAKDGVENGQQYIVYTQESVKLHPKDKKNTLLPAEEVGRVIVLRTEQNTATVLVLDSKKEFSSGTRFSTTLN